MVSTEVNSDTNPDQMDTTNDANNQNESSAETSNGQSGQQAEIGADLVILGHSGLHGHKSSVTHKPGWHVCLVRCHFGFGRLIRYHQGVL